MPKRVITNHTHSKEKQPSGPHNSSTKVLTLPTILTLGRVAAVPLLKNNNALGNNMTKEKRCILYLQNWDWDNVIEISDDEENNNGFGNGITKDNRCILNLQNWDWDNVIEISDNEDVMPKAIEDGEIISKTKEQNEMSGEYWKVTTSMFEDVAKILETRDNATEEVKEKDPVEGANEENVIEEEIPFDYLKNIKRKRRNQISILSRNKIYRIHDETDTQQEDDEEEEV